VIYSDDDILRSMAEEGGIRIDPFNEFFLQPASYDLHLSDEWMRYRPDMALAMINVYEDVGPLMHRGNSDPIIIRPWEFILCRTIETVSVPMNVQGRLDGKSSIGRLGLTIHSTAGNIDPGNSLRITLEVFNQAPFPITLHKGIPIGQIVFCELKTKCRKGYEGKYKGSEEVEASRMHLNFKKKKYDPLEPIP